ncbi:MAG TPA: multidrug transporter subunit MdtC, partial [Alcaligenaceae bacterium]|nr:multidrug transporter subunit MdtC [Alcaligenaceae bacterium]
RLFQEFAITLAVAIGLSLLISLSLTPMMCARLLRAPDANTDRVSYLSRIADKGMQRLTAGYKHGLDWVLASQTLVLWVAVATLALTGALYLWVPKGFFPQQDTGMIQAISEGPQAASFSAMSRLQTQAAEQILQHPEVAAVTSFIGVDGNNPTLNTGRMQIALVPHSERSQSAAQIMDEIAQDFGKDPDFRLYLQPVQELTVDDQVSRAAYQLALSDPEANVLFDWVPQWLERLQQLPQLAEVTTDLQQRGLQVMLDIDRDAAARLGVSKATIDDVLYDAFGQRLISTIYTQSSQYRVVLEVAPEFRLSPQSLRSLYLPTRSGEVVPLLAIATPKMGQIPLSIDRLDQFPATQLSFNVAPGYSLSDAVEAIQQSAAEASLPDTTELRFLGAAQAFESSLSSSLWLLLAAVVTMYIVLGILYESYIHPITILSTLPSATIGALAALLLTGRELDMVGVIGIILLIGIVKKNAIMMIDFALVAQRQDQLPAREAIHQAALLRFRPILMTTFAALFSAVPLMLATGSGAEMRQPLGLVMVGGLICSQVLTLFTTPVIYLFFDRWAQRWQAWRHRSA